MIMSTLETALCAERDAAQSHLANLVGHKVNYTEINTFTSKAVDKVAGLTFALHLLNGENLLEDNLSLYRDALRVLRIALTTTAATRQDGFGEGVEAARKIVAGLVEDVLQGAPAGV